MEKVESSTRKNPKIQSPKNLLSISEYEKMVFAILPEFTSKNRRKH